MALAGTGTLVNIVAISIGSGLGSLVGQRLPSRLNESLLRAIGLVTVVVGIQMGLTAQTALQSVVVLLAMAIGVSIGEAIDIERGLMWLGHTLEIQAKQWLGPSRITRAFVTSSIVFLVGPMAILGSIQDGLGDPSLLLIKSGLDGVASIAFTASLGIGTFFSLLPVAIYQGILTLLASQLQGVMTDAVVEALTAVGGLLVLAVGLNLLEIARLRLGNFLPALPLAAALTAWLPLWTTEF
ncbi:MAG: DUF554 domain-containing protein [Cyanobacteria bacterium P01_D01_bin.123]